MACDVMVTKKNADRSGRFPAVFCLLVENWRRRRLNIAMWRCDKGVSAVEFALLAPILGIVLLTSIDLGRAISERMAIDHALRAGAQSAMTDPGETSVLSVMQSTARTNFTVAAGGLTLTANRFCACPQNVGLALACSTICAGSIPTFTYYRMSAQKTFSGGFIPAIALNPSMQVQIR